MYGPLAHTRVGISLSFLPSFLPLQNITYFDASLVSSIVVEDMMTISLSPSFLLSFLPLQSIIYFDASLVSSIVVEDMTIS
jgi:hypothetical protein